MTDQVNEEHSPTPQQAQEGAQTEESGIKKLEEQLTAIQGQLAMFALRTEVNEKVDQSQAQTLQIVDEKLSQSEKRFNKLIDEINKSLKTFNETLTGFNSTMTRFNTAVAGVEGQLTHFGAVVNQMTARQDSLDREKDQIRNDLREVREDIDGNQTAISQHSSLLTGQGQMMRQFQEAIYGVGAQESVFGLLREMKSAQSELSAKVDEVVRWKDAIVSNMVKNLMARLGQAWGWRPVQVAAYGAAMSGLVALAAEVARLL